MQQVCLGGVKVIQGPDREHSEKQRRFYDTWFEGFWVEEG